MSDDEIVRRIAQQCGVMVMLQAIGRKQKAQLFADHVLRLVYTHRTVVERWMETRKPKTA